MIIECTAFEYTFICCELCTMASGNILASGNISLKLIMALLETIELLTLQYEVADHHIVQL